MTACSPVKTVLEAQLRGVTIMPLDMQLTQGLALSKPKLARSKPSDRARRLPGPFADLSPRFGQPCQGLELDSLLVFSRYTISEAILSLWSPSKDNFVVTFLMHLLLLHKRTKRSQTML